MLLCEIHLDSFNLEISLFPFFFFVLSYVWFFILLDSFLFEDLKPWLKWWKLSVDYTLLEGRACRSPVLSQASGPEQVLANVF